MTVAAQRPAGWWRRLTRAAQRWRDDRQLTRHAIPDALWAATLVRYPFLACRPAADVAELRRLSSLFLARKEFTAVGLRLSDAMAVGVAAQACLPVLRFGLEPYDGFVGVVIHRDAVVAQREWVDDHGVVHQGSETLAGEAMERGPVMLSWRDVASGGRSARRGYNVVIHEFAHVFDLHYGLTADRAASGAALSWATGMAAEFQRFESELASDAKPFLDAYGGESPVEFFAVAAEAFFVNPTQIAEGNPALYDLLCSCFRQDPASDAEAAQRPAMRRAS